MKNEFVLQDVKMDGFQMVRGSYFQRQQRPSLAIWKNAIKFNGIAYADLSFCECVQLMVHKSERQIIVKPCPSSDKDAIRWIKNIDKPKPDKLECTRFTGQLFAAWKWDADLHYRSCGTLARNDGRLILLFDFTNPEIWDGASLVRE